MNGVNIRKRSLDILTSCQERKKKTVGLQYVLKILTQKADLFEKLVEVEI